MQKKNTYFIIEISSFFIITGILVSENNNWIIRLIRERKKKKKSTAEMPNFTLYQRLILYKKLNSVYTNIFDWFRSISSIGISIINQIVYI
jgi:hypothetical protein